MHPESEKILQCLRAFFSTGEGVWGHDTASTERCDWNRFLKLIEWHGLIPLVYASLRKSHPEAIPPTTFDRIRSLHQASVSRSLFLSHELKRVLGAFQARGIPVYPFKGPALSALLYGDVCVRSSRDLDILIPSPYVDRASQTLESLNFSPAERKSGAALAAHRRTEYESQFHRKDGRLNLELQWDVLPRYFHFPFEWLDIWKHIETRNASGMAFPVLPWEETLLLLCVHGAKHRWAKLGWVCDVAGVLRADAIQWERLLETADRTGSRRMMLLGLHLAESLLRVTLPGMAKHALASDPCACRLARDIAAGLPARIYDPDRDPRKYLFYWRVRERRRDQLQFAARLAGTLALGEWNPLALPDLLTPLYYVFRPLHMAGRHGGPVLRALARK